MVSLALTQWQLLANKMLWPEFSQLCWYSLLLTGCGQIFVGFVSNPQVSPSSVSGIVIVVHLETSNDINGNPITFTAVTFSNRRTFQQRKLLR